MCWKKHLTEFIIIPWIRAALYTVFNIYLQKSLQENSIKGETEPNFWYGFVIF